MMMFLSLNLALLMWSFASTELFLLAGVLTLKGFLLMELVINSNYSTFSGIFSDILSISLVLLTIIVSVTSWMAIMFFAETKSPHGGLIFSLSFFLVLAFLVKSPIYFYFWFEASLIPIFIMILGWGYQPERLFASKSMFLYTILGSLPLLMVLISLSSEYQTMSFLQMQMTPTTPSNHYINSILCMIALLSFLIKFPMYGVHLWLPKAHVEAPVSGSMILAGVLLKLGGFGIFRMHPLFSPFSPVSQYLFFFSLFGGALISIICITQNDMKVLIAYSSVSHMSMAIAGFLAQTKMLSVGALAMMLCHGTSSAALFLGASTFYLRSFSRNIVLNKGSLLWAPKLSMLWALICVSNMAGPPSFNLFTEIVLFLGILGCSLSAASPLMIMGFFSAAYTLVLYSSSQHSKSPQKGAFIVSMNFLETASLVLLVSLSFFAILAVLPILALL